MQPEDVAVRILAVRLPGHVRYRLFRECRRSAGCKDLANTRIDIRHVNGADEGIDRFTTLG